MNNEDKPEGKNSYSTSDFPGYPHYPSEEDITRKENNSGQEDIDDENSDEDIDLGLDIPGSGDDNSDEVIGEEDEENNYYSLGGDNHEDLEEDKGD